MKPLFAYRYLFSTFLDTNTDTGILTCTYAYANVCSLTAFAKTFMVAESAANQ
jgi:hypothetical protein